MSSQTALLLEDFEALPEDEKRVFTVEFLLRAVPFDSGPLDDSEIAGAADDFLAKAAEVAVAEVIGEDEDDVGLFGLLLGVRGRIAGEKQRDEKKQELLA